ncbi:FlgO family outer membrane protein [Thalassotalea eurytherma]|uniref:FlgO domain-containing protein n=1 Tax=Thalassotalea eurytherma TaxID=1144278 RepID=A0ABQ6H3G0_9GAMM|nr:FlgO family outer membrane protein [Thalassotalea eurytherma]GLX82713.1 hypothetical protein theurythT_21650 [Thalassotalea eurytherma]
MKPWLAITLPCLLMACSSSEQENQDYYQTDDSNHQQITAANMPVHAINDVVKVMADNLVKSSDYVSPSTPLAVASFVNLDDLESTHWLGNQLSESLIYELQHHGLKVVDFKTTGNIRVTKTGDFVQSRDWQQLPSRQIIDYIVTGTMAKQDGGVMVNARIIGMKSHIVVATSQAYIPDWVVGEQISKQQNVKLINGKLVRESQQPQEKKSLKEE